jgi:hypothetical protein
MRKRRRKVCTGRSVSIDKCRTLLYHGFALTYIHKTWEQMSDITPKFLLHLVEHCELTVVIVSKCVTY